LINPQGVSDTGAPLVHNPTTSFPDQSPARAQERVQIVRFGVIDSFNNFKYLQGDRAGTPGALWFCVSGGSVVRRKRGLEPDFSKGGTGVQAGKLERVGSLIPGKPIRATERRRGRAARVSSR
jgi:hypothetical protein